MEGYTYPACMQERVRKHQRMVRKQILITAERRSITASTW